MSRRNDQLIVEIHERFDEIQKKSNIHGKRAWTAAFHRVLFDLGIEKGYKVYTSSLKEKTETMPAGGEWLFDLCWSIEGEEDDDWMRNYKGLKLICESEWLTNI